ncbi:hypothetical protein [Streptomyces prasinus]
MGSRSAAGRSRWPDPPAPSCGVPHIVGVDDIIECHPTLHEALAS